jgi:hypothetical protein
MTACERAAGALAAGLLAFPAASAQTTDIDIGMIDRGSVCGIVLPLEERVELEITVDASDGDVDLAVHNLPGEIVRARSEQENVEVHLDIGDTTHTAPRGIYRAGFTYKVMAIFRESENGLAAVRALETAPELAVRLDDLAYGPAPLRPQGFAYSMLANCLDGKGMPL